MYLPGIDSKQNREGDASFARSRHSKSVLLRVTLISLANPRRILALLAVPLSHEIEGDGLDDMASSKLFLLGRMVELW